KVAGAEHAPDAIGGASARPLPPSAWRASLNFAGNAPYSGRARPKGCDDDLIPAPRAQACSDAAWFHGRSGDVDGGGLLRSLGPGQRPGSLRLEHRAADRFEGRL